MLFPSLPLWGYITIGAVFLHISIMSVTLYLHRYGAHGAIGYLHPVLQHVFRFFLWLLTGMTTKEWVAVHRKHHTFTDRPGDPHSPRITGLAGVLFGGVLYYRKEAKNPETLLRFGYGAPEDWIEQRLYSTHSLAGVFFFLAVLIGFLGLPGLFLWGVQMLTIPFLGAGVVNGIGHWWGYRNQKQKSADRPEYSRNFFPIGIVIGGEELHANHHDHPWSAKFSRRWWEFDIGWLYIRILEVLRLVKDVKTVERRIRLSAQ